MATLLDTEKPSEELLVPENLAVEEEQEQKSELPEKYEGKSIAEIARMHQEAESLIGRQSQEVGELRQMADQLIKANLETPAPEPAEEIDFYSDPEKAVRQIVENHPKVKEAEQVSTDFRRSTALAQLQSKHPDLKELVSNNDFADWVKGSAIRTELFHRADSQYDYAAADELFSTFKATQSAAQTVATNEKKMRKADARAASTGSTHGGEAPGRKIYRRADILKLMKTDPDRYMAMEPELRQAYAENRVK